MRLTPFVSISLWFTAGLLCDFSRRCRDMASMAVRCVGHRLSSHYQSNSSSLRHVFDVPFFSVFFQCLSVSNLGMQAVVLTWKFVFFPYRIEHYPTSINTRIKLRFRSLKKKISGVRADRTLFARLAVVAVVAQSRSLDMRSVLHCELGPVPWSLATPDGGLVKTDKSCLLHLLESGTQPVEDVPPMAAFIGYSTEWQYVRLLVPQVIHFHIWLIKCFDKQNRDWSAADEWILLLTGICRSASSRQRRERRAAAGMLRVKINQPDQRLPNWKKFLAVSNNKIALNHDWFFLHPMDLTTVCQKVAQLQALSLPWKLLQCPDKHQWSNSVVDGCSWAGMPPRRGWHAPFLACTARCFFQICCCYHTLSWHWRLLW